MAGRLAKHTSMRGRLALLLIALLVVPMALVGLLTLKSTSTDGSAATEVGRNGLEPGERILIREEALNLQLALDGSLAELRLELAREVGGYPREPRVRGLGPSTEPPAARVIKVDASGQGTAAMSSEVRTLATFLAQSGREFAGYSVLPSDAGIPGLFLVAYLPARLGMREAKPASEGGALALREVAPPDGAGLLDNLPDRSRIVRSLHLLDGTRVALNEGSQFGQGAPASAAESVALLALRRTQPASLPDSPGDDLPRDQAIHEASGSIAWAMLPLRDPTGAPVACALLQAHRADLLAPDHSVPMATRMRTLVGWIAVSGVLLALAIAFLAPRWIWGDIRQSTDSIFHSVERLRELVRRNSRALDEQSRVIRTLTSSTSALKLSSQSISDTTRALAHSAEQSAWVSQSGNQKAELSQRAVLEVRDRVEQISVQMEELERRCGDIGKILGFIDHLSNETNTLSVNAAIQAVGAGSSGRQFSVVAGEIRKLADLALESTRDIQQLIEQIQESSETTLSATRDGCREVDKCLASFEELESAFARILRWVEETTRGSHGIEQSTARQSDSLRSVVLSIEELEQRAGETAGNFHEVVAAADELARLGADMNETWRVG